MKVDPYEFWNRIDNIRTEDLQVIAQKAEIKYRAILAWRTNQSIPKAKELYGMAKALGVSMEYLLTGEAEPSYTPRTPQVKAIFDGIMSASQAELDIIYRIVVKGDNADPQRLKNEA